MERRLALAAAAAAAATFGIGTVCFAALGGTDILGLSSAGTPSMAAAPAPKTVTRVVVVVGPDGSTVGTELVTETLPDDSTAPLDTAPAAALTDPTAAPVPPASPTTAAAATASPDQSESWSPWAPTPATTTATTTAPQRTTPTTTPATTPKPTATTVASSKPTPVTTHVTVPAPATTVATTPPTTAHAVVTTTTVAAPTSTLPRGVPANWPVGKPIPPKPPNCVNGQLEDNGVWNCEH